MAKTLQTSPVDPKVEAARQARATTYATRHVQTKAEQQEALAQAQAQAQAQARSPGQAQQAVGALLSGSKFYISWTISTERRRELRQLIQSNGGEVLKEIERGAVELVENNSLKTGQTWVSVDFVYDLVRDQTLPDITQYMAESWQTTANELSPGIPKDPKPRSRIMYTPDDDVKIFQFVNVTAHPAESMRERYRRVLTRYTPQERRNIMKHAKDADDARQRRELAAINANPEVSTTTGTTVSPATEKEITPEIVVTGAQVSEITTAEPHVVEEGNNVSTSESNAFEEKRSPPVAEADTKAKEDGEEEEDEEIHGRGKKQARKSATAAAAQQKAVSLTQKEIPHKEIVADAEDSQEPPAAEVADTAAAAQPEPTDDVEEGSGSSSKENEEKPQLPSKKQRKQKLKRNVAPPQQEEDEPAAKTTELTKPTTAGDTRKTTSSNIPLVTPPSREVGTAGIFFRSRWEQLINDASNRQQLQQYFNLTRPREAPTAPAPAVGGKNLRKLTPGVRAVASTPSQVNKSDDETAATTSSSAATTTRRRKRTVDPASTAEEEKKEETVTLSAKPAPSKKRKVRPISQPRKAAGAPLPAAPAAVAVATTPQVEEQEEVIVTSESEIDSLICQLQFATNQELNTVTHALYYSSGDLEVALSFLQGACPADFWSEDDDLLLTNLMSDATDARKVADARRQGAFINMRVRRTAAQILARIRYLL